MIHRYSYDKSCQSRLWQNIKQIKHPTVMMPDLNQIQQGKAILKGWNKFGKKNIKNIEQH